MNYGKNRRYDGCLMMIGMAMVGLLLGVVYSFVLALIGVWLWNYAMVSTFGVPEITFWKMFALMVLVRLFIPTKINYEKK